jgi:hypothetical protein
MQVAAKNLQKVVWQFLPLVLLGIFLVVIFKGVRTHSQSWYFQDETEHVTLGWMMERYGKQLYSQLNTPHQPVPVLVGMVLSKILPYQTLFELIERLRLSMFIFWAVSCGFLVWRFKWRGLTSSALLLSLTYYYFGFHVLAESLVAPGVLLLGLLLWQKIWPTHEKQQPAKTLEIIDAALAAVGCWWVVWCLLPCWPFVLGWSILYFLVSSPRARVIWLSIAFIASAVLFAFVPPADWYRETITNNLVYFIPFDIHLGPTDYIRFVIYPLLGFTKLNTELGRMFAVLVSGVAVLVGGLFIQVKPILQKKWLKNHWSKVLSGLAAIGLLFVLNNRVPEFPAAFYQGFHLFPYLSYFMVLVAVVITVAWEKLPLSRFSKVLIVLVLVMVLINNAVWVLERKDKLSEHFIQYGEFQAFGSAIKMLKQPGDTLMTGAQAKGYTNMIADVPIFGKQNFHLEWSYRAPDLRAYFEHEFATNPPTFIYFSLIDNSHSKFLKPLLAQDYYQLKRADGRPTDLYLRKSATTKITPDQWQQFENLYFQKPIP